MSKQFELTRLILIYIFL